MSSALGEDDLEVHDQQEGNTGADGGRVVPEKAVFAEEMADVRRDRRFAEPAEAERADGDADLDGGKVTVQVPDHLQHKAGAGRSAREHDFEPGLAGADEREFGEDEEDV
jgi:hypothetical protein